MNLLVQIPFHPEINFRANSGNQFKPIRNRLNIFINPLQRIFAFRRGIHSPDWLNRLCIPTRTSISRLIAEIGWNRLEIPWIFSSILFRGFLLSDGEFIPRTGWLIKHPLETVPTRWGHQSNGNQASHLGHIGGELLILWGNLLKQIAPALQLKAIAIVYTRSPHQQRLGCPNPRILKLRVQGVKSLHPHLNHPHTHPHLLPGR